ncbi:hypothetical protein NB705_003723 [Xanthomonas sacchari]|nr:hypothetical protein [Xanthomonas sacchari]
MEQHIAVGHLHRMSDTAIAHRTAVDVEVLLVGAGARVMRLRDPAMQAQAGTAVVHAQRLLCEVFAQGLAQARVRVQIARLVAPRRLAVVRDAQLHVGARQRQRTQPLLDVAQFGAFGAQELAPRRHVVEQLADLDQGARRQCARLHLADLAAFDLQRCAVFVSGSARGQGEAADRGDRRQRFAAKPERAHRFQVVQRGDLAGRVPRDGQRQFLGRDAATVVADADQAHAAFFQIDVDAVRTGVQRVLHQFLDDRGRTLDHFAGGDLVDQDLGQLTDAHAVLAPCAHRRAPVEATGRKRQQKKNIGTARGADAVIEDQPLMIAPQRLPPATVLAASASACARAANSVPGGGCRVKKVLTPSSTAPAMRRW